ncbi:hypothetical protein PBV87_13185 [Niameybacter massiliensis]|uniref:Uncharacterized protein n=1 Tax=Holtiella tumoricola TaxID=3018743 RepID=A0AA42DNC6_9FIRM|nr:hypothetical protein [Holtiella tumoricola]MDA3732442.1 hypothetical protein [Holtiella tumoricola]
MKTKLVGIYEIAEATGVTASSVINWRKRYKDFPSPIIELKSGPIFNVWEIEAWLRCKPQYLEIFKQRLGGKQMNGAMRGKKIAIVGPSRTGKSRILSRFMRAKSLYDTYFTGGGGDFTEINICVTLLKELDETANIIRFVSEESSLNGIWEPFTPEGVKSFLHNAKVNDRYKEGHENSRQPREKWNPKTDRIEIVTHASEFAIEIMGDSEFLELMDCPGVSGHVEGLQNLADIDVFIFTLRSQNEDEFEVSLDKMVDTLASARILYVFGDRAAISKRERYPSIKAKATEHIQCFVNKLRKKLSKGSILEDSIELLNPDAKVVPMGAFEQIDEYYEYNLAEKIFDEDLSEQLKVMLNEDPCAAHEKIIQEAYSNATEEQQEDIIKFIMEMLGVHQTSYTGEEMPPNYKPQFLKDGHDRVKSNDGNRVDFAVKSNRNLLIKDELYKKYNMLQVDTTVPVDPKLQATIIQYCFLRLSTACREDCGISRGNHMWEDCPPLTMWGEEAVLAEEILTGGVLQYTTSFMKVMTQNGISSASWSYVFAPAFYVQSEDYYNKKLEIIVECGLDKLPSKNMYELIYNTYNLSLFKIGQYRVCEMLVNLTGASDTPMDWLKTIK